MTLGTASSAVSSETWTPKAASPGGWLGREELSSFAFIQLRLTGSLLMGSGLVQGPSDADNGHRRHPLRRAVAKAFLLHRRALGSTSVPASPVNRVAPAAHRPLSLSGLVLA